MTTVKLKWWDAANDRRQELILKKWQTNDPMTDAEILELILLQDLAEQVLSYDRDLMLILASKSANTSSDLGRKE